jgi:hypothetical protein
MLERKNQPTHQDDGGYANEGWEIHRYYFGKVYQFRWQFLNALSGFGNPKVQVCDTMGK